VAATRSHPGIDRGASPRAVVALVKMAKAAAWLRGRDFVTPNDVCEQFSCVVSHRMAFSAAAKMGSASKETIIESIVGKVRKPLLGAKG
jgi:MoxR-like ATPase